MDMQERPGGPSTSRARVVFGLIVMLVGGMMLIDRLDWRWGFEFDVHLWPFILILLGVARLSDRAVDPHGRARGRRSAVWLLVVGVWGLINEYRMFGLSYGTSWPLLLIAAGGMIVWRSMAPAGCTPVARREP